MPLEEDLEQDLARLRHGHLLRAPIALDWAGATHLESSGHRLLNFSSNDYLGYAHHPAVTQAASRAALEFGAGAGSSRLVAGTLAPHSKLEHALADWMGREAALLFGSGYQANLGLLSALTGPEDILYSDALNHASIVDGCRLSRATVEVYPHADADHLATHLRSNRGRHRRRFIISETLFSMDGDVAPLEALARLAREEDATLVLDEAHAIGVRGPSGRGLAAELNLTADIVIGTLGKAFGGAGAFITGSHRLRQLLETRARSYVFTTAPPPSVCASASASLELIRSSVGDADRLRLAEAARRLRDGLKRLGLGQAPSHDSQILPVIVGEPQQAMDLSLALRQRGLFVQGIRPPTVPPGTSRLRLSVTANHTSDQIDQLLAALEDVLPSEAIQ